jgi:hypothetical protein
MLIKITENTDIVIYSMAQLDAVVVAATDDDGNVVQTTLVLSGVSPEGSMVNVGIRCESNLDADEVLEVLQNAVGFNIKADTESNNAVKH